jgi:hypothetical protein
VPGDFFSQHSKILTMVRFFMKHVHRPNITLRDVVRISGDHYARQTSHYLMLQDDLMIVNKNLVYVPRKPETMIGPSFRSFFFLLVHLLAFSIYHSHVAIG